MEELWVLSSLQIAQKQAAMGMSVSADDDLDVLGVSHLQTDAILHERESTGSESARG